MTVIVHANGMYICTICAVVYLYAHRYLYSVARAPTQHRHRFILCIVARTNILNTLQITCEILLDYEIHNKHNVSVVIIGHFCTGTSFVRVWVIQSVAMLAKEKQMFHCIGAASATGVVHKLICTGAASALLTLSISVAAHIHLSHVLNYVSVA